MDNKKRFNDIPVHYCSDCLSLKVLEADGVPYCEKCGNTVVNTASIEEWDK
jgi:ribosomal protein L37AE/L43A